MRNKIFRFYFSCFFNKNINLHKYLFNTLVLRFQIAKSTVLKILIEIVLFNNCTFRILHTSVSIKIRTRKGTKAPIADTSIILMNLLKNIACQKNSEKFGFYVYIN